MRDRLKIDTLSIYSIGDLVRWPMKKVYVKPEVVIHGTVEDITQVSDMVDIVKGHRGSTGRNPRRNRDPDNGLGS